MTRVRALLPYALASVGVVLASAIAVGAAIYDPVPEVSAQPTPRAKLSDTGRLAYWKRVSDFHSELWVSDLDGRRAWPLLRELTTLEIGSTRWSPDGSSVGYIRGNTSVVIAGTDGMGWVLQIPRALLKEDLRIVGHSLSPSTKRIALTVQQVGAGTRPSDVFLVELLPERRRKQLPEEQPQSMVGDPAWTRVTELGDAYAGRWISNRELFIETRGGMIARLDIETKELWPVTGMHATSPLIGGDGRLYFAGGAWVHSNAAGGPWGNGGIWSAALDGSNARSEVDLQLESVRLAGRLADGRFVVASPGSTYLVGDRLIPTPWRAGTIRRVVVPADGSDAIGITDTRVVRIVPSKIPDAENAPPEALSMLLDGVRDADAWFPPATTEPIPAPPPLAGPPARLAFIVGSTLWEASPSGALRALLSAPPGGWIGQVAWSPAGDRIAAVIGRPEEQPNSYVVVADASGELWRSAKYQAATVSWSPDGSRIAVPNYNYAQDGEPRTTTVLDARSGAQLASYPGVDATWTARGLVGVDSGVVDPAQRESGRRIDHAVYFLNGARVTDARALSTHSALRDLPGADLPAWLGQIDASPDGRLIGVWVYRIRDQGYAHGAFVVVDASGEPQWVVPFEPRVGFQDLSWSPTSAAVGMTLTGPDALQPGLAQTGRTARVAEARTGKVLREQPGEFAGWSPDGEWFYVARPEGLFAFPLAGGDGVRVGPFGVRVHAAHP